MWIWIRLWETYLMIIIHNKRNICFLAERLDLTSQLFLFITLSRANPEAARMSVRSSMWLLGFSWSLPLWRSWLGLSRSVHSGGALILTMRSFCLLWYVIMGAIAQVYGCFLANWSWVACEYRLWCIGQRADRQWPWTRYSCVDWASDCGVSASKHLIQPCWGDVFIDRVAGGICEQAALHRNIMFRETIHHLATDDSDWVETASESRLGFDWIHRIMERAFRGRVGFPMWRYRAVALSC